VSRTEEEAMFTRWSLIASTLLLIVGTASAQDLTGTYVMTSQNTTLTLVLRQNAQGALSGTLSSTSGAQFQVDGMIQDGVGVGTCVSNQGGSYFEAHPEGGRLLFALIEPGPNNAPDYSKVRKLLFVRQGAPPGGVGGGMPPGGQTPLGKGGTIPGQGGASTPQPSAATTQPPGTLGLGGATAPSGEEVGDPNWAFAFRVPMGWKHQKGNQGAILGHDTIPGLILVLPHEAGNAQQLQQQMQEGLQDETIKLVPAGKLQPVGNNAIAGDYTGVAQGSQVKARGIGVLGSQGGGAYIIAMATPQVYGTALTSAAEAVARSLRTVQQDASDLVRHFAGTWVTMTKSTHTMVALNPNGTYSNRYEAGYSGGQTGSWGIARDEHSQGRWTVRGTKQQGVLVLTNRDGSQTTVRYQVHVERGQTYWREYYFNGDLYGKQ
jgi:hypothetical protein